MYRAKQAGKARCELFDPGMHAAAVKRLRLETDLRKALQLREFRVYYQPIISLQSGRMVGVEALTRWPRPSGMVMPADFIPVADETGLILPMNRLLMEEALEQLRLWHAEFPFETPLYLSVNVSPKEFAQPELAADIALILQHARMDPSVLQLEITETVTMADGERASMVLSELKTLGVRISIDDFGTGYSSLSRLQGLPVDSLKIDRAFISQMGTNPGSREIVRIIVMLAHNLGLRVVAEGTETAEQVDQVTQLTCEMAQGYFFSRPVEPQAISELLRRERNLRTAAYS